MPTGVFDPLSNTTIYQDGTRKSGNQNNPNGDKKNAPPPGDYTGAAERTAASSQQTTGQQTVANRPNQENAFGSSVQWAQNPDGTWTQKQSFGGPLGDLSGQLQGQALNAMRTPFDLSHLPGLTSGEDARKQAIDAAYGQATSRLDPMYQQRESQLRTELLNRGLSEGGQAYNDAMSNLGRERNDAYQGALNSAIGQGTQAGNALFNQSLQSRESALAEMLKQREIPLGDLGQLAGFTGQAGFSQAGRADPTNYLAALLGQDSAAFQRWQANNDAQSKAWDQGLGLLGDIGGSVIPFIKP